MKATQMMKWMAAAVVLMMVSTTLAFAQQRGGGGMNMDPKAMAQQTVERLTKELKLDKAQQDSVYKYQLAQSEEMGKMFSAGAGGGDREAMRAKMTELREATDKKIMSVLNDDQKKAYEKIQAQRQNFGGPQGGGRRGGGGRG